MQTEPIVIPDLAGPVVVTANPWTGKHSVTVGGQPASGDRRGNYELPAESGGTVPARLRLNFLQAYPALEIAGVKHPTGPSTPIWLRIVALLPVVLVAFGLIGGVIAGLGVVTNFTVARSRLPKAVQALVMAGVLAVGLVTTVLIVAALKSQVGR